MKNDNIDININIFKGSKNLPPMLWITKNILKLIQIIEVSCIEIFNLIINYKL